jgi:ribosomal protein S6--L-glutamate ligase
MSAPSPVEIAGRDRGERRHARPGLRVGLLVESRYLSQAQPAGLAWALRERGHLVTVLDPQARRYRLGDDRWLDGLDLLVARGRSWELLCLLHWAETCGVRTINRRTAVAAVHNKAEMAVALAAGRIPTPRTFLGSTRTLGSRVRRAERGFPMVLKPMFGDNGRGLHVVHGPAELDALTWPEPVALAQEWVEGDGFEHKVYGIGDELWVVRRPALLAGEGPTPSRDAASSSELLPVTFVERELAVRCRRLFGLDLYGIDCIQTPKGPLVLEVNEFPNYTGVPEASERLVDYVLQHAWSARGPRHPEVHSA